MTWVNDNSAPLYCVKRKYAEEYHCGSYSYVMPKMYKIGNAKSACRSLNKYAPKEQSFEEWKESNYWYKSKTDEECKEPYEMYCNDVAKGPWVVATVQFTASEIEDES